MWCLTLYEIEAEERRALDHSSDEEEEDEEEGAPGPASPSLSSYEATDAPAVAPNEEEEEEEDAPKEKHTLAEEGKRRFCRQTNNANSVTRLFV